MRVVLGDTLTCQPTNTATMVNSWKGKKLEITTWSTCGSEDYTRYSYMPTIGFVFRFTEVRLSQIGVHIPADGGYGYQHGNAN